MIMKSELMKEVWQYRELLYFFVWRDVKVRYRQTVLGGTWAVMQPIVTMVIFTIFFGKFAQIPSDGIPYPIFYYCALVPWTYFSGALSNCGNSLVSNSALITKVYFPRLAIPVSSVLVGLVDFCIASAILIGLLLYYQMQFTLHLLLWPVLVVPLVMLALGLGLILASLNVKYRDIRNLIPFAVQALLFATPIIYPQSIIPDRFRILIALNPLTGMIAAFRASVVPSQQMDWSLITISVTITVVILTLGLIYFRKTERSFADII